MATVSRTQFDYDRSVTRKIFQQGQYLADADLNEQIDIALDQRRRILSCSLEHEDARFDDGFKVVQHDDDGKVTIKAGNAAFHLDAARAILITLASDEVLTGFSSWVAGGGDRTDIVYIDIEEKEYSPADDLIIVNPAIGAETCRDMRIDYTIAIAGDTSTLPTAPAGHVYRELARITKDDSDDRIVTGDITLTLGHFRQGLANLEVPLWTNYSTNLAGADAEPLDNENYHFYVTGIGATLQQVHVVRFPYVYNPAHNYLALYCECWKDFGAKGYIELRGFVYGGFQAWVSGTEPTQQVCYLDPRASEAVAGQLYEIRIVLKVVGDGLKMYMQRPYVVAGLGAY